MGLLLFSNTRNLEEYSKLETIYIDSSPSTNMYDLLLILPIVSTIIGYLYTFMLVLTYTYFNTTFYFIT